jgi:hypothetical protein
MALHDFFTINMPYGIKVNEKKAWAAFNRDYKPLGCNDVSYKEELNLTYTKYKGITEKALVDLAWHAEDGIKRDEHGSIIMVFFYNPSATPQTFPECWNDYLEKIKRLSKFKVF